MHLDKTQPCPRAQCWHDERSRALEPDGDHVADPCRSWPTGDRVLTCRFSLPIRSGTWLLRQRSGMLRAACGTHATQRAPRATRRHYERQRRKGSGPPQRRDSPRTHPHDPSPKRQPTGRTGRVVDQLQVTAGPDNHVEDRVEASTASHPHLNASNHGRQGACARPPHRWAARRTRRLPVEHRVKDHAHLNVRNRL